MLCQSSFPNRSGVQLPHSQGICMQFCPRLLLFRQTDAKHFPVLIAEQRLTIEDFRPDSYPLHPKSKIANPCSAIVAF